MKTPMFSQNFPLGVFALYEIIPIQISMSGILAIYLTLEGNKLHKLHFADDESVHFAKLKNLFQPLWLK